MNAKQQNCEWKYKQQKIKRIEKVVFYLISLGSISYFGGQYLIYLIK